MVYIKNAGYNHIIYAMACLYYKYNYSLVLKEVVFENLVFMKGNIFLRGLHLFTDDMTQKHLYNGA